MMKRIKSPPKTGLVLIIIGFFAGSGVIRAAIGANAAIAAMPIAEATDKASAELSCSPSQTPSALAQALLERETAVTARETRLEARKSELQEAEIRLREQLAQLEEINAGLEATIALAVAASEQDLSQLTAVYEAMKPVAAAELFSQMPADFASGFLARMSPSSAAGVLAGLEPEVAYAISAHLAGRNANVPTE